MIDDIKKATIDRYVMKSEGHTNWVLWSMLDEHESVHIQTCIKEDLPIKTAQCCALYQPLSHLVARFVEPKKSPNGVSFCISMPLGGKSLCSRSS